MNPARIDHIALQCQKPEVTAKFYIEYLNFKRIHKPAAAEAKIWLEGEGIKLHLFQAPKDYKFPPEKEKNSLEPTDPHMAFESEEEIEEVDAFFTKKCRKDHRPFRGNCFNEDPTEEIWHDQVFIKDPDGKLIEIFTLTAPDSQPLAFNQITKTKGKMVFKIHPQKCVGVDIIFK
eukprot:Gb_05435 [translate_table: standard]